MADPQWSFADFRLDPANACLWRGAQAVALTPKVFDVLHYLVTHADRLVTKDALLDAVWPETAVSDGVVRMAIGALRQALGDTARAPRYIATVQGRGYRFIAPVTCTTLEGAAPALAAPVPLIAPSLPHPLTPSPPVPQEALAARRSPDAMAGERKRVTVLFCDLVDSTPLAERLGPEVMHRLLNRFFDLALHEVRRYEGAINQFLGDGFMALFGAPMAHEDHVRRALLAALGLQRCLREHRAAFEAEYGMGLRTRMGLNTGLVVVGTIGDNLRMDYTAVGDTTNLAARLQQLAAPDTILVSAAVGRLAQGLVALEALAPLPVKGKRDPVTVYKVLGLGPHRAPLGGRDERRLSPLLGRARELALLDEVLEQVERGQGQAVGIVGEAGVGKSRLLYEFRQRLAGRRVTVLEGHCLSYGSAMPYLPLLDLLRSHCGMTETDSPEHLAEKVRVSLQEAGLEPAECAPYLLHLLGVPAETEPLAQLAPEAVKARTFATLRQIHLHGSQRQPLILVIEDLHWIDTTSEEYLTTLVESLAGAPLLVLGTYRTGYRLPWLEKSYTTQFTLRPLSPQDSLTVVHATRQDTSLPEALVPVILEKAEGNPFFLEELTRAMLERGALGAEALVPDTIQGVLMARIDRLPEGPRHLLQTASVLGRTCPRRLLEALWAGPGDLEALMQDLQRGELLYARYGAAEVLYVFKHALTQEVAYDSLLQERRRVLHARIVETLEALTGDRLAEQVERLAHHALRGEVWAKALMYCRQAGEKALARSAHREAVGYFEQALSVLPHLPETRDTREQAIDLRLALRSALAPAGDLGRILVVLREAETLANALDDPRRLGQVSLFLSVHFYFMGAHDQAIAAAQRALALATASGDVVLYALANHYLGVAYQAQGDYRRAINCFGQTVMSLDGAQRHEHFGEVLLPSVNSRALLAVCHAELGMFAEGGACGDEGLRIAEAVAHPGSLMAASWRIGLLALRQGNLSRALPRLEQAVGICQDVDLSFYFPKVATVLGAAYTLGGRVTDAVALLTQAMEQSTTTEGTYYEALCGLSLGEAHVLAGRLEEAYALAERVLALARAHQERGNQAYALHLLGEIAAHRNPPETEPAEASYRQALALAEELGMRPLQAHCHRGLGTLYGALGRHEPARTALSTAIDLYRAMDMTFWLPQTEAALVQVGGDAALRGE